MKKILTAAMLACAFVSQAQTSLNMDSLFNWRDTDLVPSNAHFNTYNEIWGYAKNGAEYAIIGTTAGTHIFDVTNPANSQEVVFVDGAFSGPGVIHRDYHDYADHLYMVCDEGPSTLQIADLSFLPDSAPIVYNSDALFPRSHNIFIDTSSARMYVCGGTVLFAVYSLADPANPTLLVNCPTDVPFWSSVGYIHDVYVRGDTAYLNAETRGLFIVDFSDLNDIRMLGSLDTYPQSGYNHSGWLMPNQSIYAFADETHGMDIKIVDVSDMTDLIVTDTIGSDVNEFSIPHNLIYTESHLFVSHYFDGVYMFECSDPAHPTLAGYYDTSTEPHQDGWYRGCWGVYPFMPSGNILASDMQSGLWVLRPNIISGVNESAIVPSDFQVYPNPTDGQLYVPKEFIGQPYSIINMQGQVTQSGSLLWSLDVSGLNQGLYVLSVEGMEVHATTRFCKGK
ncbi:MAG: hypothetical protein RL266_1357 [Bacteroidota bacterium]|jgi:choice-of-anchor B domain-containing protein